MFCRIVCHEPVQSTTYNILFLCTRQFLPVKYVGRPTKKNQDKKDIVEKRPQTTVKHIQGFLQQFSFSAGIDDFRRN